MKRSDAPGSCSKRVGAVIQAGARAVNRRGHRATYA
jgi:hypothetical protein